jgi:hypothetical protein
MKIFPTGKIWCIEGDQEKRKLILCRTEAAQKGQQGPGKN